MTESHQPEPLDPEPEAEAGPDAATARLADHVRLIEAVLFAAAEPMADAALRARLPADADLGAVLGELAAHYAGRGVTLVRVAGGWAFRTAPDLAARLRVEVPAPRRLSRAALETLAIVAYHQPVTRAEIEAIRGVATSKGTLDVLLEAGWIRPGRRRQTPGRPLTWVTDKGFLDHFGLVSLDDLPGVAELRAAGLLDSRPAIATLPGGRVADREAEAAEEGEPPADPERDGEGE
jgi:segregation and condensation protein B